MKQLGMITAGLAITCGLLGFTAGQASAGCSSGLAPAKEHASTSFVFATNNPELAAASFATVADVSSQRSAIVGLWEFEVRLNGAQNGLPDKALLDWGLATWHDDGTEIQFSAGRPPSSGDVCMGVWHENGKHQFILHHVALGLTPATATGTFVGPTIIRAAVSVNDAGNSFSGPYSLTVYPGSPTNGTEFNDRGKPLVTFSATVLAKRVAH